MVFNVLIVKVKDYEKWQPTFDEDAQLLKDNGAKSAQVLRGSDDPNLVVVITEWKNKEIAKKLAESDELKTRMQTGGVIGKPTMYFLDDIGKIIF